MALEPPVVTCPYCQRHAQLVNGTTIYPHRAELAEKKFWLCVPCDAYVGTHVNSARHHPLGRLANAELRNYKRMVHAIFDPLWKKGPLSRSEAYEWLAQVLEIGRGDCHVGMFDVDRCRRAVAAIKVKRHALGVDP